MRWWIAYVCLFGAALATALLTTPLARTIAIKLKAIDYPNARRVNTRPVPRMGGIAILCALSVAFVVQVIGSAYFGWPRILEAHAADDLNYGLVGLSFLIIFATGAIDDIYSLKPWPKFAGQLLAAVVAVAGGVSVGKIVSPFSETLFDLQFLSAPLTVLYLVSYVNIINLIDGLDGLATGISCIASTTMFVLSTMAGRIDASALSIAVAGATLGFLRYNFNPASIFLGDCGSLLLGFALGVISMLSVRRIAGLTTLIVPLVVAGIPIIDTASAIIRRWRAHISIGQADRGHIHHRLIAEGFDQKQAVLLIYAWTALLCAGSLVMTQVAVWPRIFIFVVLLLASFAFANKLHLFEPVLRHHYNPKTGTDELVGPDDPAFTDEATHDRHRP